MEEEIKRHPDLGRPCPGVGFLDGTELSRAVLTGWEVGTAASAVDRPG